MSKSRKLSSLASLALTWLLLSTGCGPSVRPEIHSPGLLRARPAEPAYTWVACAPGYICLTEPEAIALETYLGAIDRWSRDHEKLLESPKDNH